MQGREIGSWKGEALASPQADAIWKGVLDPRKMEFIGSVGGELCTGTLAVVPLDLSLEPHNPVSPLTILVHFELLSLHQNSG